MSDAHDSEATQAYARGRIPSDLSGGSVSPEPRLVDVSTEVRTPVTGVQPTTSAISRLSPVSTASVSLDGGFWGERLRINRERSLGHGFAQLERAGTLQNFRLAAGLEGSYRALGADVIGTVFPFLDTDVYKWLEAAGWELGRTPDPALAGAAEEAIGLVARAQRPDGYLNTYVQVIGGGRAYQDLAWGHELYCLGHLIQAAIAWYRALGDDRLLAIATRAVDSIGQASGPAGGVLLDGHPEIEMALVELYRTTGDRSHLELATRMIEARGHGAIGDGRFGRAYWQDHLSVREAPAVAGHAVRQLYLDCGAVDVATETGDERLLEAVRRRWHDMVATRTYLTGGLGSRHRDESFGDPYELPPDGAYAETCAAIASVMLAWRLLLATGDPDCADTIERAMYNGVLAGSSLDGTRFFYVNTLQRRSRRVATGPGDGERVSWMPCACCPPNLMRFLSSWPQHIATTDSTGIQIQQYATADLGAEVAGAPVRLRVDTAYPWQGAATVTVLDSTDRPWTLSLRVPAWCSSATLRDGRTGTATSSSGARTVSETRTWAAGDSVVVELDMPARVTEPDPRIDAVRGCVALERGPLVYCIETADLPSRTELEAVELEQAVRPTPVDRPDIVAGLVGLSVPAADRLTVGAIPYFAWANRSVDGMRVWIPRRPRTDPPGSNHGDR